MWQGTLGMARPIFRLEKVNLIQIFYTFRLRLLKHKNIGENEMKVEKENVTFTGLVFEIVGTYNQIKESSS